MFAFKHVAIGRVGRFRSSRIGPFGRLLAAAGALFLAAGCAGRYDVNEVLRRLVDQRGLNPGSTTVTIRISNQTQGTTEKLTLRIDGLDEVFECPYTEMVCDYPLGDIPDRIETVQEERYDEEGGFVGGRILLGQSGFTLDRDDYEAGSVIVFLLGAETAEVRVL